MRRVIAILAAGALLVAGYLADTVVLPAVQYQGALSGDFTVGEWAQVVLHLAAGAAAVVAAWIAFRFAPSRLVGAIFLLAGLFLSTLWPFWTGFAFVSSSFAQPVQRAVDEGGFLYVIGPYLAALGAVRLLTPMPRLPSIRRPAEGRQALASPEHR